MSDREGGQPGTGEGGEIRRRSGGRSARVQAEVFAAVLAELVEVGYAGLTVPGVARRAGVHKTTIYRRWEDRDSLLVAALAAFTAVPVEPQDTGSLERDLRRYAEGVIGVVAGPSGRVLRALFTSDAGALDGVSAVREQIFASRRPLSAAIIERAVGRGDVPAGTDPYDTIDYLVAPIYFRLLLSGGALDDALAGQAAAATAAAARAGAFRPGGAAPES
ncbi:hypothetical protein TPB0596_11010 [Tsukamurella pulmonis]|uniref:TetR/AcrR family transcriptional regulator n=1 Tax=Tsukamurella pulmonis TaxID=47312 RepID=UPI000E08DB4E|nr:TetR/AcrR family transcriptional regulator [Tsukamurella pulmonis]RDH13023.1 TetR/AcrR family transcriptional regulator [Tsukamurella pulmonis]BDD81338.1 hypothetical protein TPB0596_11010 [Tsukamurella pulmonis]